MLFISNMTKGNEFTTLPQNKLNFEELWLEGHIDYFGIEAMVNLLYFYLLINY